MSERNFSNPIQEKKPQGQAIAGMVLGIVGLLFSFGAYCVWFLSLPLTLVGVILSALAIKKCSAGVARGKGMAIAGLVTSIIGLIWTVIWMILWGVVAAAIGGSAAAFDAASDYNYNNYDYNNDWEQEFDKAMDNYQDAIDDLDYYNY